MPGKVRRTWKKKTWWQVNPGTLGNKLCLLMLHNIVIDIEDDTAMPSFDAENWNYHSKVRQLAKEDAVRLVDAEDHGVAASGSGVKDKEQEQQRERDNASRKIIV